MKEAGCEGFESLPWPIAVEILSRLHDFTDLGRCRMVSKTLSQLSRHVHSLRFYCSYHRFVRSRSEAMTPFKWVAVSLLRRAEGVRSVRFDMEEAMHSLCYEDDQAELSDYWLTDVDFVLTWLPCVGGELRELSITDFWQQSCWRCTKILALISAHSKALCTLELRNAWLSVEGLQKMATLNSLTLESIRLNDESLTMVNQNFPALEKLHLINVGGLKDPCICLLHLRVCHWTVSNAPTSLSLVACELTELKLQCCRPERLIIDAPLLTSFHLSMEKPGKQFKAVDMPNLKVLVLDSLELYNLIRFLSGREFVETLLLELPVFTFDEDGHWDGLWEIQHPLNIPDFVELRGEFPKLHTLIIGSGAWYNMEQSLLTIGDGSNGFGLNCLKKLVLHMILLRVENTYVLISRLLHFCPMLSNVEVYMHQDSMPDAQNLLISKTRDKFPHVRWKWNVWTKGLHGI